MKFYLLISILKRVLIISAASFIICLFVAIGFGESIFPFLYPAIIVSILAISLHFLMKTKGKTEPGKKEAFLAVTLSWVFLSVIGAIPFILSGYFVTWIDALFESTSGFTTTGSSILTDIEALPKSILFWRSLTHWIGGIGIIVLVIIIMPTFRIGSYHLFTLESSLQEKIKPQIKSVGYRLIIIYLLLTVTEIILLCFGNMNLFESVCHTFGTVATGGFSPKNTSLKDYSPYIQYVVMIFMLLGGTNFVIHYYLLKRKFKKIKNNEEFRYFIGIVLVSGFVLTLILFYNSAQTFEQSFRDAFFQTISIITCTGFATADYLIWPQVGWVLIFFMMFIGGSTGSTAGGIKIARHIVLLKGITHMFKKQMHPKMVSVIKLNNNIINEDNRLSIKSFITWYLLIFILGTFLLIATGLDGESAAGAAITTMGGIGPGIGTVGPASNFFHLSELAKIILIFLMLLGRLELFTILVLFTPDYWKK